MYRGDVLSQLLFSNRTLTEDFDLTLQIHDQKLGKIVYLPQAKVITQDPPTLRDYWKQVTRWCTGFWQNVRLHKIYKFRRRVDFEVMMLVADGLSWIVAILLAFLHPQFFLTLLILSSIVTEVLALAILALDRQWWAIKFMPLFVIFPLINVASYCYSFFRAFFFNPEHLTWQKVRRYAA